MTVRTFKESFIEAVNNASGSGDLIGGNYNQMGVELHSSDKHPNSVTVMITPRIAPFYLDKLGKIRNTLEFLKDSADLHNVEVTVEIMIDEENARLINAAHKRMENGSLIPKGYKNKGLLVEFNEMRKLYDKRRDYPYVVSYRPDALTLH